ncbi:MAG TPA: PQQ-dependent sugar dehydrogenase [Rhodoglobus sp.]|nr:PQQ-dependent sugar dehydrogenase [Rhodoglobus sp.]
MRRAIAVVAGVLLLAGCTAQGEPAPVPSPTRAVEEGTPAPPPPVVQPAGDPVEVIGGLAAPWSMVRLDDGSTLISERDTAIVKELTPDGSLRDAGVVPGVVPGGEGGLLGLAVADDHLYTYFTAADDNRIVRFPLEGAAGSYSLGAGEDVLTGLAKAGNHNGGRLAIGPDGKLYATVGDASQPALSQDPAALNGSILRMELDGSPPDDNPTPGSLVYSYGHRNPQGLAWDPTGRLWAAEFGQNTWDEVNLIEPAANFGWPVVEGVGGDPAFVNPVYQWSTDDASPSGLTWVEGTMFMAGLGGERLWSIVPAPEGTTATEWYAGAFGRIRDVIPGPDGTLWMLTNNTDGRGEPREGDDRILQVTLAPVP